MSANRFEINQEKSLQRETFVVWLQTVQTRKLWANYHARHWHRQGQRSCTTPWSYQLTLKFNC